MSAEAKAERMEELLDKVFNKETSCGALLKHCDKSTCVRGWVLLGLKFVWDTPAAGPIDGPITHDQPYDSSIPHVPTYSINYVTKQERYSPLTVLCSRQDVTEAEVKKALFLGANKFHKDEDGCTALHWAAMKGVVAAVAVLTAVSSGASSLADVEKLLKTKDGDGKTPLALAKESVEPDHEEVQALLVSVSVCEYGNGVWRVGPES